MSWAMRLSLLDPARHQFAGLFQHLLQGPGAQRPPQGGDHAVGAAVGAPLRNLQVCRIGRRRLHAGEVGIEHEIGIPHIAELLGSVPLFRQDFGDPGIFAGTDEDVHLGEFRPQFLLVALGKAPGNDQERAPGVVLPVGKVEDGVDALLLRLLDEGAGVDDDDIRFLLVGGDLVLFRRQAAEHHLGVHQVLRAAQADHADFLLYAHACSSIECCVGAGCAREHSQP